MKCQSCQEVIDPKSKHAIEQNSCPYCGQTILPTHLKELFSTLRLTMDQLQKDYQEQVSDFLLSNYSYIKTDDPNLASFVPKEKIKEVVKELNEEELQEKKKTTATVKTKDGDIEVEVEKLMSDNKAEIFHKRANMNGSGEKLNSKSVRDKNQHIKELKERIEKEAALGENTNDPLLIEEAGLLDQDNQDVMMDYEALVSDGGIVSGLQQPYTGEQEAIPNIVLNMANKKANAGNNKQSANDRDMQSLQNILGKSKSDEDALASGRGGFSRGSD